MILATLPGVDPKSGKGVTHLIIVGILLFFSMLSILILSLFARSIPDVFPLMLVSGITYLFGVNVAGGRGQSGDSQE